MAKIIKFPTTYKSNREIILDQPFSMEEIARLLELIKPMQAQAYSMIALDVLFNRGIISSDDKEVALEQFSMELTKVIDRLTIEEADSFIGELLSHNQKNNKNLTDRV